MPDGNLEQVKAEEKSPLHFPGINRPSDSAGDIQALFWGEVDHRASLLCLLHPHPILTADRSTAHTLMQVKSLSAALLLCREEKRAKEAAAFLQLM